MAFFRHLPQFATHARVCVDMLASRTRLSSDCEAEEPQNNTRQCKPIARISLPELLGYCSESEWAACATVAFNYRNTLMRETVLGES